MYCLFSSIFFPQLFITSVVNTMPNTVNFRQFLSMRFWINTASNTCKTIPCFFPSFGIHNTTTLSLMYPHLSFRNDRSPELSIIAFFLHFRFISISFLNLYRSVLFILVINSILLYLVLIIIFLHYIFYVLLWTSLI